MELFCGGRGGGRGHVYVCYILINRIVVIIEFVDQYLDKMILSQSLTSNTYFVIVDKTVLLFKIQF